MTIKDVAAFCGVSVTTVSRVLNGHPDVNEDLRKRVQAAISELHFVPNVGARDLVKTKSDTIGIIAKGIGNPFYTEIIPHLFTRIIESGYGISIREIDTSSDEIKTGASLARSKKLRGLILLGGRSDYTAEQTAMLGAPFVCCTFGNEFSSLDNSSCAVVSIDDRKEAGRAVDMLYEKGHRKIAIVLSSSDDKSVSQLRYEGYRDALLSHGITPDEGLVVRAGSYELADVYNAVEKLLEARDDFTAIFAISDTMGVAAMKAISDSGRKVPDNISVLTIDGIELTEYTIPSLTTLSQPKKEIAETSVELLLSLIGGEKGRRVTPEAVLREGGSVAEI